MISSQNGTASPETQCHWKVEDISGMRRKLKKLIRDKGVPITKN
jgi:hypothetical protein